MLCYAMPCHAMPYYAIPCHAMLLSTYDTYVLDHACDIQRNVYMMYGTPCYPINCP